MRFLANSAYCLHPPQASLANFGALLAGLLAGLTIFFVLGFDAFPIRAGVFVVIDFAMRRWIFG